MTNWRRDLPDWWKRDRLLRDMWSDLGQPYYYGGDSTNAPDCSEWIRRHLQEKLLLPPGDYSAQNLYDHFKSGTVDEIVPAALLFFGAQHVTHVAIALTAKDMLEAGGGTSNTRAIWEAVKDNAWVRRAHINRRNDLFAICDPFSRR